MYIYSIRSKINDNEIYIGSTKQTVNSRGILHKSACKSGKSSPLYNHIRENGGFDNYYIELLEEFNGTIDELKRREGEIIREFKKEPNMFVINHNIAGRSQLEYKNDKYREDNEFREKLKDSNLKRYYKKKETDKVKDFF